MPRQIVLFGGTFDPVHHGHLIAAQNLAEKRAIDRIVLVPAADPPHKAHAHAGGRDRLEMLRLATAGDAAFELSDIELTRTGPSYTLDTIVELRRRGGDDLAVHWVLGADMLADLPNWHRAAELVTMAEFIVLPRPPWHLEIEAILQSLAARLGRDAADRLRRGVVELPLIDISSSDIRRRVRQGRSIRYLVPEPVRRYIRAHGLYRDR